VKRTIFAAVTLLSLGGCADPAFQQRLSEGLSRAGYMYSAQQAAILNTPTSSVSQAGIRMSLESQSTSGTSRFCVYDRLGSPFVVTFDAADICPLSLER
jgi:hypothetical protein